MRNNHQNKQKGYHRWKPQLLTIKSYFLAIDSLKQLICEAVITSHFLQRCLTCPTDWAAHPEDPHLDHQTPSVPFSSLLLPV